MRSISIPALEFSAWRPWSERGRIEGCRSPGVYLIAVSDNDLAGRTADWGEVCYVGKTTSQGGLLARWRQFDASTRGLRGHSGGKTMFKELGPPSTWTGRLFVAAMPVRAEVVKCSPDDLKRLGWISFLEYEALSEYCAKVGGLPRYNTQHAGAR